MGKFSFPHMVSGDTVGGVEFKANGSTDGGFFTPTVLGLVPRTNETDMKGSNDNDYFGGKCNKLGLNKATGFYICAWNNGIDPKPDVVMGIWVPSLDRVSEYGKTLLRKQFGDITPPAPAEKPKPEPEPKIDKRRKVVQPTPATRMSDIPFSEPTPRQYADPNKVLSGRF